MRGIPRAAFGYARALFTTLGLLGLFVVLAACTSGGPGASTSGTRSTSPGPAGSAPASITSTPATRHPAAGKTAAPPVPGNVHQTVASRTVHLLTPKPVGATVTYRSRALTASVLSASRVEASARIPGEIAGPALSLQLRMTNRGAAKLPVGTLIAVTAFDAAGQPLSPITTSSTAISKTLRPGASTVGRYVFHLPTRSHDQVTIEVTFAATAEVARFIGSI